MDLNPRILFALSMSALVLAIQGCSGSGHRLQAFTKADAPPPVWMESGPRIGAGRFTATVFLEDKRLGRVGEIKVGDWMAAHAGLEVGFAHLRGVAITTLEGHLLEYADFRNARWTKGVVGRETLVDADGDGNWEFYRGSPGVGPTLLVNRQGGVLWSSHQYVADESLVADAYGDLDGDGDLEFVISTYGKMFILDHEGHVLKQTDSPKRLNLHLHSLFIVDVESDGQPEIVASTGKTIDIFDSQGELLRQMPLIDSVRIDDNDTTMVRYPALDGPPYLLGAVSWEGKWKVIFVDMAGTMVCPPFEASPLFGHVGIPLRLRDGEGLKPYFVMCGMAATQGRATAGFEYSTYILQVFDSRGQEVYREHLQDAGESLAGVTLGSDDEEGFLVGGKERVLLYRHQPTFD